MILKSTAFKFFAKIMGGYYVFSCSGRISFNPTSQLNGSKPLTIFAKRFILDVSQGSEYASVLAYLLTLPLTYPTLLLLPKWLGREI